MNALIMYEWNFPPFSEAYRILIAIPDLGTLQPQIRVKYRTCSLSARQLW